MVKAALSIVQYADIPKLSELNYGVFKPMEPNRGPNHLISKPKGSHNPNSYPPNPNSKGTRI